MKTKSTKRIGTLLLMILAITQLLGMNFALATMLEPLDTGEPDWTTPVSLTIVKYAGDPLGPDESLDDRITLSGIPFKIESASLNPTADAGSTDPADYTATGIFTSTKSTDEYGMIRWDTNSDGMPQGIFLITELPSSTVSNPGVTFLVSLPNLNEDGTDWVYEIIAYPKNDIDPGPEIDKELINNKEPGNYLTWQFSVNIPNDIADALKLVITDILDNRLTYVANSIQGSYKDSSGTSHTLDPTSYSVSYDDLTKKLIITITPTGFTELANALTGTTTSTPMLYFSFETSASTTDSANIEEVENGGDLDYTNEDGNEYESDVPDKPTGDLYAIHIKKINVSKQPLAGAEFMLYSDAECTKAVTSDVYTTVSPTGDVTIYGLSEGTYYLKETKAPAGYNPITKPIKVVVNASTATNYVVTITVTNSNNFLLPQTGGAGTLLFTVGGLALIVLAGALLFLNKKKSANKDNQDKK